MLRFLKLGPHDGSQVDYIDLASVVYVRDVAHVRDGSPPQTNIVRQEGHRAALMSILKTGTSSTLDVKVKWTKSLVESTIFIFPEPITVTEGLTSPESLIRMMSAWLGAGKSSEKRRWCLDDLV